MFSGKFSILFFKDSGVRTDLQRLSSPSPLLSQDHLVEVRGFWKQFTSTKNESAFIPVMAIYVVGLAITALSLCAYRQ